MSKVKVIVPVIDNSTKQIVYEERMVGAETANLQLSLPDEKRHPAWRGAKRSDDPTLSIISGDKEEILFLKQRIKELEEEVESLSNELEELKPSDDQDKVKNKPGRKPKVVETEPIA